MSLQPGSRLGAYEILDLLGAGGMGEVYRARDTRLDRTVAVKVLQGHLSVSPETRQRFERTRVVTPELVLLRRADIRARRDLGGDRAGRNTVRDRESLLTVGALGSDDRDVTERLDRSLHVARAEEQVTEDEHLQVPGVRMAPKASDLRELCAALREASPHATAGAGPSLEEDTYWRD